MKVVLLLLIGVLAVSATPTWTKTLTTQLSDVGGHTTISCHCNGCSADKHTVAMADNATACAQACIAANNANAGSCKISLFDAQRNVPPMGTKCFLYSEHPTADNTNPNAGVSSQGLSRFTCWQPADTTVSTPASGVSECSSGNRDSQTCIQACARACQARASATSKTCTVFDTRPSNCLWYFNEQVQSTRYLVHQAGGTGGDSWTSGRCFKIN